MTTLFKYDILKLLKEGNMKQKWDKTKKLKEINKYFEIAYKEIHKAKEEIKDGRTNQKV